MRDVWNNLNRKVISGAVSAYFSMQYVGAKYNNAAWRIAQPANRVHFFGTRSDRNPGLSTCHH